MDTYLSLVNVVGCASATSWSFVQGSPTNCISVSVIR